MIYLKLLYNGEPVAGDATTQGYEQWIGVESFRWSMTAKHTPAGPRLVRTELRPGALKLSKVFDRSSTVLYEHMMKQRQLDSATIVMVDTALRDSAEKPQKMLQIVLKSCFIRSVDTSADEDGKALKLAEEMTLSFEGGSLEYFPDDAVSNRRPSGKRYDIPNVLAR